MKVSGTAVRPASFLGSENPPILHRKETLLSDDDPRRAKFEKLTEEAESHGLYENPRIIGFKKSWESVIRRKGLKLNEDGTLERLIATTTILDEAQSADTIHRHKTAISRNALSVPLQILAKRGYLNGDYSIFDYGCGKGDDLRELSAHDLAAAGWDPVFQPDSPKQPADIVNVGYVINVIEDPAERESSLRDAASLAKKLLVVSAMLWSPSLEGKFKRFKYGVITKRNTFQKYFYQGELKNYVERTVGREAIAAAPGVFFIFR